MAKRNRSGRAPQPRHGKKSQASRHDKRARLKNRNPRRKRTQSANVPLVGQIAAFAQSMATLLDARNGFRLPIVLAGAMLATSRRTASRWFRCAGVADDWDRFYDLLISVGRKAGLLMLPLLIHLVKRFGPGPGGHWKIAIDDSPTRRFGRHVEAAGVHYNPTRAPADGPWLYGHNWVCLALLMKHSLWGVLALPMLSRLYVRQRDIQKLSARHHWEFRTKHELALELARQVMGCLRVLGSQAGFTIVVDGAYVARSLLRPLISDGARIVSRLRRDAQLFDLPPARTGRRGRPRKYGQNRISLARRAGRRDGWLEITYSCRGVEVTRRYKSFLATSKVTGGAIRVVLLEYERGNWAAYFSTDVEMGVQEILETVADRWAIEEHFHDAKEVWRAGEQQVRNVWSSVGCWHLNSWLYTMVELACWDMPADELVDRRDRSWDNPARRPSHADRRRTIVRQMLEKHLLTDLPRSPDAAKYHARIIQLLSLAA